MTFRGLAVRLLVGVGLFVALGEIVARASRLVDRLNVHARWMYTPVNHPDLPYRLRPGFGVTAGAPFAGNAVRVNQHGLRGPEIEQLPRSGWRRVLVVGDSVVYGHALREAESFPVRLAEELTRHGVHRAEILNGGVSGWDTSAEAAFLEQVGLGLEPDVVLLGVSLNDYRRPPVLTARGVLSQQGESRASSTWLEDHSDFFLLVRSLGQRILASGGSPPPRRAPASDAATAAQPRRSPGGPRRNAIEDEIARRHARFYSAPEPEAWSRVREALARMARLTREHGIAFKVMLFPESFQFQEPEPDRDPQRAWLSLCAELGLDCLDLWPAFATASDDPASRLFNGIQHPNAAGTIVAARAVAASLLDDDTLTRVPGPAADR